MSAIEDSESLVVIGEMIGREVRVYCVDFDPFDGILHAITNHGILVKNTDDDTYEIYPWWQVKCVVHGKSEDSGEAVARSSVPNTEDEGPEIIESPKTIVMDNLPEGYDWEWEDEDNEILITDDEGENSISVVIDEEYIKLLNKDDLELAKNLAKKLGYNKIVKDYEC